MSEPVFIEEPGSGCYGCFFFIVMSIIFVAIFAWDLFEKVAQVVSDLVDFIYILGMLVGWTIVFLSPFILGYQIYRYYKKG